MPLFLDLFELRDLEDDGNNIVRNVLAPCTYQSTLCNTHKALNLSNTATEPPNL